jgi:predicted HicB family RNase H-like nuclease
MKNESEMIFRKRKGKMIHFRLSESLHTRLKIRVAETKTTMQSWIVRMIYNALRKMKKRKTEDEPATENQ